MDSTVCIEERRKSSRFKHDEIEDFAVLFWRESRLRVEVLDESLGGICVLVPSAIELPVGLTLDVLYAGQKSRGVVRHVQAGKIGGFVAGIECARERTPQDDPSGPFLHELAETGVL